MLRYRSRSKSGTLGCLDNSRTRLLNAKKLMSRSMSCIERSELGEKLCEMAMDIYTLAGSMHQKNYK